MTDTSTILQLQSQASWLLDSFLTWFLKTRMSFYGDEDLQLPWWFGVCCWNYAVAGLCMLLVEPKWAQQVGYPYRTVAWALILVQSPLSFMADYIHMTHDSYWHVVDRFLALPLMLMEVGRFVLLAHQSLQGKAMPLPLLGISLLALAMAVYSFGQSTQAQSALDHDRFIVWHNTWHLYPLLASLVTLYDFYACGGWKRSTRKYFYRAEWHLLKKVE